MYIYISTLLLLLNGTDSGGARILIIQTTTHALQVNVATKEASSKGYTKREKRYLSCCCFQLFGSHSRIGASTDECAKQSPHWLVIRCSY